MIWFAGVTGRPSAIDHRIAEHLAGQRLDRRGHGGGEEHRLAARRQLLQDPAHVGQEAHVEHPVGLVDHQDLDAAQRRVGRAHVVEQTAGRRDDHVDAPPEGLLLRPHADAAEDRRRRRARVAPELPEVLLDLRGQLARGSQDERARRALGLVRQTMKDRQGEGRGLAAAGHGRRDEVTAFEGRRDRLFLDRGRLRRSRGRRRRAAVSCGVGRQRKAMNLVLCRTGVFLFGRTGIRRDAAVRRGSLSGARRSGVSHIAARKSNGAAWLTARRPCQILACQPRPQPPRKSLAGFPCALLGAGGEVERDK